MVNEGTVRSVSVRLVGTAITHTTKCITFAMITSLTYINYQKVWNCNACRLTRLIETVWKLLLFFGLPNIPLYFQNWPTKPVCVCVYVGINNQVNYLNYHYHWKHRRKQAPSEQWTVSQAICLVCAHGHHLLRWVSTGSSSYRVPTAHWPSRAVASRLGNYSLQICL